MDKNTHRETHMRERNGRFMKVIQGYSLRISCLVLCMVIAGGVLSGCRDKAGEEEIARPVITGVTLSTITATRTDEFHETSGTIRSDRSSTISSRVMGVVTSLLVREGDRVKAGQLLLAIDDKDARERSHAAAMALEAARQNRDLSELTFKRYRSLYEQRIISTQDMDQMETRRNVANADYERARAMAEEAGTFLAFTRITSPVAGVVTKKHIDVGSMASPGMPLLVIEAVGEAYVEAAIDEGLGGRVRAGMPAEVALDSLGESLKGTIREVLPDISPSSRTFIIKIDVPDRGLKSGLFARVKIPVGKREVIVVPQSAVIHKGQLTGVYVVDARGIVTYRLIREGRATGAGIEVLSGLKANERIITEGLSRATDGGMVKAGGAR